MPWLGLRVRPGWIQNATAFALRPTGFRGKYQQKNKNNYGRNEFWWRDRNRDHQ